MTFLVDADLPRSAADVVRCPGYDAVDVRDIGLRHADDSEIAGHAQREHLCLVTGDFDFADIRNRILPSITQVSLSSSFPQRPLLSISPSCSTASSSRRP